MDVRQKGVGPDSYLRRFPREGNGPLLAPPETSDRGSRGLVYRVAIAWQNRREFWRFFLTCYRKIAYDKIHMEGSRAWDRALAAGQKTPRLHHHAARARPRWKIEWQRGGRGLFPKSSEKGVAAGEALFACGL